MLYQLIYMSHATGEVNTEVLDSILGTSRRNNQEKSITGLLLYRNGRYFQVLEGNLDEVIATFERIDADDRHEGVRVLLRSDIDERLFPHWSMASIDTPASFAKLEDELEPILAALSEDGNSSGERRALVFKMLRLFRTGGPGDNES